MAIKPLYEFEPEHRPLIVERHLLEKIKGRVSGPTAGAYGNVYCIAQDHGPMIAAKCPNFQKFGTREAAREGIESVLRELEKTHQAFKVPWVNRFFEVKLIHGWPFVLSRYRDGTLEDLIGNPLNWSTQDKLVTLGLVARAVRLAQKFGIAAHQDLKPGNIFFDDLAKKGVPKESTGMHFHIFVGDFGMADAFRDLGRNSGTRPYMAPEQFETIPFDPGALPMFDVFALGVIAFECFTDGEHPIGVRTSEVWPARVRKWNRKEAWRDWASIPSKTLPKNATAWPAKLDELVLSAIDADPSKRPPILDFEDGLWGILKQVDYETYSGAQKQIAHLEQFMHTEEPWPYMDDLIMQLRQTYSDS